jgi:hypothetical protein
MLSSHRFYEINDLKVRKVMSKKLIASFLSLVGLIPAGSVSAGLVAHWPFDEGSGTTAVDATGGGGNATLTGGAAWGTGVSGGGLQFNGSAKYAAIENGPVVQLRSASAFTVAVWVSIQNTAGGLVLYHGEGCSAWASWFLGVGGPESDAPRQEGNLVFGVRSSNGSAYTSVATPLVSDQWIHVAATYDATTLRLFIDGQEVGNVDTPQPYNNTNRLYIGGDPGCNGRNWLTGMIDDLRIYDEALSATQIQAVEGDAGASSTPRPSQGATDVPRDMVLSWTPGQFAKTHDVYFGTGFDDVNNASWTSPLGVLASQGQDAVTYDPAGLLSFGQAYYWRVDEVNAPEKPGTYKGSTWNFTTETYGYPVKPVKATASSMMTSAMGPEKTIDGSGMDAQDQHGTSATQMWLSKKNVSPVWIQYEFDTAYKLHQIWVWNSNQSVEESVGFGAKDVTIETSLDGTTWTALANVPEFAQASGEPNYVHNTTVDFGGVQAKFVKLTITGNWADGTKQAGLSEVRFFYVPVKAFGPTPANAGMGVAIDSLLNWRPGREAVKHEVYLSTDPNAVVKGTALVKTVSDHSLGLGALGIEYGRTYTWKVNEVNDAATPGSWEGDVWSFTTPDYSVVDDFESYNDKCNRVFFAWVDGFGFSASPDCGLSASVGNGTGSTVGNTNPPFAEKTVIHGGRQSMPLGYDNTAGKSLSEATRTFDAAQDWTLGGAKTLVLYFRGGSENGAGQLYVKINGTRVDYGSATAATAPLWKQWNIDLVSVATNLKAVKTLSIGVSGSGKGILYVDDIRLYRAAPAVVQPADPGTNGLAAYYRMEADVKDGSGHGLDGTSQGVPSYVDGPVGYGKALQFDGIDDEVDLPIGTLISSLTTSSFATWVNFSTSSGGSWQRIFDFGTGPTVYMFLTPRQGTAGTLRFAITTNAGTGESFVNSPAVLPSGWHHVAVLIDGVGKTLQLCLDGDVVASGVTATLPKDLGKTTQNWLGRSQYVADAFFSGVLDEFRIYSRTLTAGEVRYLAGDR